MSRWTFSFDGSKPVQTGGFFWPCIYTTWSVAAEAWRQDRVAWSRSEATRPSGAILYSERSVSVAESIRDYRISRIWAAKSEAEAEEA